MSFKQFAELSNRLLDSYLSQKDTLDILTAIKIWLETIPEFPLDKKGTRYGDPKMQARVCEIAQKACREGAVMLRLMTTAVYAIEQDIEAISGIIDVCDEYAAKAADTELEQIAELKEAQS